MLLSFHQHHLQAAVAHSQIGMSQPLKKRLWQRLVVAKIENQAAVLRGVGSDEAEVLSAMAARVASGDPANIEAQAARAYWQRLFKQFKRHEEDWRNALLNYGYAVARAAIARACAASGLLPAFGVHHSSRANAFNLADDLLEPFRPCVDRMARRRAEEEEGEELTVEDRRYMAGILGESVSVGEERLTVLAATEAMAASLVRAIDGGNPSLLCVPALPLARRV
jgi:CRISPR-associated protein Cas1